MLHYTQTPPWYLLLLLLLDVAIGAAVATPVNGQLRLQPVANSQYTRLEVFYNGKYGSICDDGFNISEANVACKQMGYAEGAYGYDTVGGGSGPILIDDLSCVGTESNLTMCLTKAWGTHNCLHSEDVGILCHGQVRVAGGNSSAGRVEVFRNNTWGTVCVNSSTNISATADVVCRQLSYVLPRAWFYGTNLSGSYDVINVSSTPIGLSGLQCTGAEALLESCTPYAFGNHPGCNHSADLQVSCAFTPPTIPTSDPQEGTPRLAPDSIVSNGTHVSGRLEVYKATAPARWGTVCAQPSFGLVAASIACHNMGYGQAVNTFVNASGGVASPPAILMAGVSCSGSEARLSACTFSGWDVATGCTQDDDIGIECERYGGVRIHTTQTFTASIRGVIELHYNGTWTPAVCDDSSQLSLSTGNYANRACRQLGYDAGVVYGSTSASSVNLSTALLPSITCDNSSVPLISCAHAAFSSIVNTSCDSFDVVACSYSTAGVDPVGPGNPSSNSDSLTDSPALIAGVAAVVVLLMLAAYCTSLYKKELREKQDLDEASFDATDSVQLRRVTGTDGVHVSLRPSGQQNNNTQTSAPPAGPRQYRGYLCARPSCNAGLIDGESVCIFCGTDPGPQGGVPPPTLGKSSSASALHADA